MSSLSIRNVGSDPSSRQMERTKNTAIGNLRGTISTSSPADSVAIRSQPRMFIPKSSHGRPSLEGYQYAPRADITMNGAGYSNPAAQKARLSSSRMNISNESRSATLKLGARASMVTDHRGARCNKGSIGKLKKIMKR